MDKKPRLGSDPLGWMRNTREGSQMRKYAIKTFFALVVLILLSLPLNSFGQKVWHKEVVDSDQIYYYNPEKSFSFKITQNNIPIISYLYWPDQPWSAPKIKIRFNCISFHLVQALEYLYVLCVLCGEEKNE